MIAGLDGRYPLAHLHHHARALMTEHYGKHPFGIITGQRKSIGMAHPRMGNTHHHLTGLRIFHINFNNLQRLTRRKSHCRSRFHTQTPLILENTDYMAFPPPHR